MQIKNIDLVKGFEQVLAHLAVDDPVDKAVVGEKTYREIPVLKRVLILSMYCSMVMMK